MSHSSTSIACRSVFPRLTSASLGETRLRAGFTLVEMLISVAITLVMMAAVVTMFANITNSVRNRRATIEMSGQLRHVRNMLQQDLAAATCPGLTWQRPESNHGYIELIEGIYRDSFPSIMTDGADDTENDGVVEELDAKLSAIPRNNAVTDTNGNGRIDDDEIVAHLNSQNSLNGLNGLGDYDDILMFTARNEHEPYVGRVPNGTGGYTSIESPLAEIIWFAIENPSQPENDIAQGFFGEPGMRTIYRRALLIAPWLNPISAGQGVMLVLSNDIDRNEVPQALAALIAFQDLYDLSVRLEWDPLADSGMGQWKLLANTLADLSKRENRFGHYGFNSTPAVNDRTFPFAMTSVGSYSGTPVVRFIPNVDPSFGVAAGNATARANLVGQTVATYAVPSLSTDVYDTRPFVHLVGNANSHATPNAMLNDDGRVVRVVHGPVPLWGQRRGQDVMLTNVLGFDLRVFDPGAPIYQESTTQTVLEPGDPGWTAAYNPSVGMASVGHAFVGQGAYVDMGYAFGAASLPFVPPSSALTVPWFAEARPLFNARTAGTTTPLPPASHLAPGYAVYDTWSLSYENNGWDEDGNGLIDEGTNGLDDNAQFGPDDVGERETAPPYDKPLRGVQVILRVYETDARQIRQVRVNQHFMGE